MNIKEYNKYRIVHFSFKDYVNCIILYYFIYKNLFANKRKQCVFI